MACVAWVARVFGHHFSTRIASHKAPASQERARDFLYLADALAARYASVFVEMTIELTGHVIVPPSNVNRSLTRVFGHR